MAEVRLEELKGLHKKTIYPPDGRNMDDSYYSVTSDVSAKQRIQNAQAQGQQFMFGARENREMQQLDRVATQLSGAEARKRQAAADRTSIMTTAIGGVVGGLGDFAEGGGFSKN
mgnify:CR=1 FL=1